MGDNPIPQNSRPVARLCVGGGGGGGGGGGAKYGSVDSRVIRA